MSEYSRVQSDGCDYESSIVREIASLLESVKLPTGTLAKCFYLGSDSITREGDSWQNLVAYLKSDDKNKSLHTGKEHHVKLVVGSQELGIDDCDTGKRLHSFNYQDMSNIKTHQNLLTFMVTSQTGASIHSVKFDSKKVVSTVAFTLNVFEKVEKFRALEDKDTSSARAMLMQLVEELVNFVAVECKHKPTADVGGLRYLESILKESADDMIIAKPPKLRCVVL